MPVLNYQTPFPNKPFPLRLTAGPKADLFTLLRGFFLALFLLCLRGPGHRRIVCTTPAGWLVEWPREGRFVAIRLGPSYGFRFKSSWMIADYDYYSPDFIDSILAASSGKHFAGVEIGTWPYASWIALPYWLPVSLSTLALILVWHKTRLNPHPSPPRPPISPPTL